MLYLLLQSATISYRYAQMQRRNVQLAGQLHQLNVQLEKTVAVRTEELKKKNEELTKQGEQRSQLMANIAHDLGSPLIGMQNHIKLMQRDMAVGPNGDAKKWNVLTQMMSGLVYMKRMVDDLFELSRLETRHSDFHFVQIPIAELWAGIRGVFNERHEQGELEVEYGQLIASSESRQWLLEVDLQSIYRVVHNYLDNAVKFSGPLPCQVRVNCYLSHENAEQEGDGQEEQAEMVFELVDFGRGIAEEEVPYIFERFYRGKVRLQGSGLGLSIVREIISQHGGAVGVTSVRGQGSTFSFRLPLVRAKEE
jgi:signal transduction histidine kinase